MLAVFVCLFFCSSRRRHTRCALVTGVQTCALPICTSFALMVSTVEPRKNHILAFDAWAELIRIHGADAIPLLVCAGRRGWRYDQIFARLESDPALKAHVVWIHDASDSELAALARGTPGCAFPAPPTARTPARSRSPTPAWLSAR